MKDRYLEVTYRKGEPLAAYLYLPRPEDQSSVRTKNFGKGILVDFSESGDPIGVEITAPMKTTAEDLNEVLRTLEVSELTADELLPLRAA